MKVLDVLLDNKPTEKAVKEMAELRIRNLLCFRELQAFNDTGKWIQKHPLVTHRSAYARLEELFALDHTRFMDEYNRCCCNISRYESYLRSDKRIEQRDTDKALLQKHTETKSVFESVIENNRI
ncbi:MAG: hypothetical protein LBS20_13790 [Prevotella sp.]|jgi:hypothetical protein|nr:hypothetical protein [Prevotella sp.]